VAVGALRSVTTIPERPEGVDDGALFGLVVRAHGKFFEVHEIGGSRTLLATPRGTLKRVRRSTDLLAVGDRVWVTELEDKEGRIEAIEPRQSVLERLARHSSTTNQVILANPDQALFVFSVTQPEPHRRMLDRFLILAESTGLPASIAINKIDLDTDEGTDHHAMATALFRDYESIYPVYHVSARERLGLDALIEALRGRLTVIAGPSGVGKSSLLNAIDPSSNRATRRISEATGKGRHTTTSAEILQLGDDIWVADTPGIRALAMRHIRPETLDQHFPEFRPYLGKCFYVDCAHITEPGCAVREALEEGAVSPERYASYVALRQGEPD
jgi:ribosome biogenesis GTPase / thiamine phosphate phosphatase